MAADIPISSGWLTIEPAIEHVTSGARTEHGRRKMSPRFLRKEVEAGRLRAARIGGRGQLLFKPAWLDEWLEQQATPVLVTSSRRRA